MKNENSNKNEKKFYKRSKQISIKFNNSLGGGIAHLEVPSSRKICIRPIHLRLKEKKTSGQRKRYTHKDFLIIQK